jgi:hypothetical protein
MIDLFNIDDVVKKIGQTLFLALDRYASEEIRLLFFVTRGEDIERLESSLLVSEETGDNFLLVGESGVGKSAFLSHFLNQSPFVKTISKRLSSIDLGLIPHDQMRQALRMRIVRAVEKLFQGANIQKKLWSPRAMATYDECIYTLDGLKPQLEKCDRQSILQHVIIDDVDHLGGEAFCELLEDIRPLLLSPLFSVVIACRRPAYNAIRLYHDLNITFSFSESLKIELEPLAVGAILSARTQFLSSSGTLATLLDGPIKNVKPLWEHLKSTFDGPTHGRDKPVLFKYPFAEQQEQFMQEMSNGNIRQVLMYAQEFLTYMADDMEPWRKADEGDHVSGYWVGRSGIISHFTRANVNGQIRIHDLNERKTHAYVPRDAVKKKVSDFLSIGCATYILVMETIEKYNASQTLDPAYLRELEFRYGISPADFSSAVADLQGKFIIRERTLAARDPSGHTPHQKQYELTDRGTYYLKDLIHWQQYIDLYGISTHLKKARIGEVMPRIEDSLLQFAINIMLIGFRLLRGEDFECCNEELLKFTIAEKALLETFSSIYLDSLFNIYDKMGVQTKSAKVLCKQAVSPEELERHLFLNIEIAIRKTDEYGHGYYLFLPDEIRKQNDRRNRPMTPEPIVETGDFQDFVKASVTFHEH